MPGSWRTATTICLLPLLLQACGGFEARAPVSQRSITPAPAARIQSRGGSTRVPADGHVIVKRGDTLYSIAWQHGMEVSTLAALNHLHPPYTLYPGQRLQVQAIPDQGAAPLATRPPLTARPLPAPASATGPVVPARSMASGGPVAGPAPAASGNTTPARAGPAAPVPAYDGKWTWPTRGKVIRGFQEDGNGKRGIDIGGNAGQPVLAAASGKVVYVGSGLVGYGRLIIVKHNESLLSAYGHNSKLLVSEGDYVRAGQTIAQMGSSGASRTMLYFEIRKDGKPVNPATYLP